MTHGHTVESLIAFRDRVADAFREKKIRCPVHFPGGNEKQLIEVFCTFRPGVDWLCSNWRNMYHCLLAGMPEDELFAQIIAGRSMFVMSDERQIICSSIVGGVLPIACGLALAIKRNKEDAKVWCAVGDMTATTGLYHEFFKYCTGHDLPVNIVLEDNGLSTNADTEEVWGTENKSPLIFQYRYERTMPHVGLATRVSF